MTADAVSPSHEDESAAVRGGQPEPVAGPEPDRDAETPPGARTFLGGMTRDTKILVAALLMAAVQLAVTAQLLSRQWFFQDDFPLERNAHVEGLTWQYLMTPHNSHLMPGGLTIAWVVTRISPMNWGLVAGSMLVLQALAAFAVFRLLRLLFGLRPAILLLFALFLFSPLSVPASGWWSSSLEVVPYEAMLAFALGSHILYLRSGARRHAIATFAFTVLGFFFMANAVAIPFLLYGICVYYFTEAPTLRSAALRSLAKYWRIWPLYLLLVVGYESFNRYRLDLVHVNAGIPDSISENWKFGEGLIGHTFIPGLFGGPWKWFSVPNSYAFTNTPNGLVYASWVLLAAVVAVSLYFRNRADRAWLLLAGYLVVGDVIPVLAGRIGSIDSGMVQVLGTETRYIADASVMAAICVGLAFLPVVGEAEPYRRPRPAGARFTGLTQAVVGALAVVVAVGFAASTVQYHHTVSGDANRAWFGNARTQLAKWTDASSILDTTVPGPLNVDWDYPSALASFVMGSVAPKQQVAQIAGSQPVNVAFTFDDQGYLRQVSGVENGSVAPPGPKKDWGYCTGDVPYFDIHLPKEMDWSHWTIRMDYADHDPTNVDIQFGIAKRTLTLPAGVNNVTFNLPGNGSLIRISGVTSKSGFCVQKLDVGTPKLE